MGIDDEDIPEVQLLTLPETALPQGGLARLWAIRSNAFYDRDFDELLKELTGASPRHLIITAEQDQQEKEVPAVADGEDRLLAQIEERQGEIEKCRREIDDNALRLCDGRRVYVDGDRYRVGEGRALAGADEADAARQHEINPGASTWRAKQQADGEAEKLGQLKRDITSDKDGGSPSAHEQQFNDLVHAAQATVDYGKADYIAGLGDYYTISTVPAFTEAAQNASRETLRKLSGEDTDTQTAEIKREPMRTEGEREQQRTTGLARSCIQLG